MEHTAKRFGLDCDGKVTSEETKVAFDLFLEMWSYQSGMWFRHVPARQQIHEVHELDVPQLVAIECLRD